MNTHEFKQNFEKHYPIECTAVTISVLFFPLYFSVKRTLPKLYRLIAFFNKYLEDSKM